MRRLLTLNLFAVITYNALVNLGGFVLAQGNTIKINSSRRVIMSQAGKDSEKNTFKVRPLENASQEQVAQLAVEWTEINYKVLSGKPQVVVARQVKTEEFKVLGFGEFAGGIDENLMLVIIKGNFDVASLAFQGEAGSQKARKAKYIAYVFDLKSGIPILTVGGLKGNYFKDLLKDQTIPSESELSKSSSVEKAVPAKTLPIADKLPYGELMPGLTEDEVKRLEAV